MKIYLSGPITGLPLKEAKANFAQAAKQIEAFGHEPVNPFDNGLDEKASWNQHLVADIALLLECEGIYLIKGWEKSNGACIEQYIASKCGMAIIPQPDI